MASPVHHQFTAYESKEQSSDRSDQPRKSIAYQELVDLCQECGLQINEFKLTVASILEKKSLIEADKLKIDMAQLEITWLISQKSVPDDIGRVSMNFDSGISSAQNRLKELVEAVEKAQNSVNQSIDQFILTLNRVSEPAKKEKIRNFLLKL